MLGRSILGATLAALILPTLVLAQAPPLAQAPVPERAVINFIVPIDSNTTNLLLTIVNNQVRAGVKKITIVISSPGGDTASAFAAYNILKNVPAEITTFNAGNVDSAAMLIFCAGKFRYSFPNPARFLIHSNALVLGSGVPMDYNFLDNQMQQIKSLNADIVQVIAASSHKKTSEVEEMMKGQTIVSPDEAKDWGLIQDIRSNFMEPGAVFVTVNNPAPTPPSKPLEYTTIAPTVSSGPTK